MIKVTRLEFLKEQIKHPDFDTLMQCFSSQELVQHEGVMKKVSGYELSHSDLISGLTQTFILEEDCEQEVWNGESLPPVGTEVMVGCFNENLMEAKVVYVGTESVVVDIRHIGLRVAFNDEVSPINDCTRAGDLCEQMSSEFNGTGIGALTDDEVKHLVKAGYRKITAEDVELITKLNQGSGSTAVSDMIKRIK